MLPESKIEKLSDVSTIIMGQSPPSDSYNQSGEGLPFFQGKTDFGELYPIERVYCSDPKKIALKDDILISVRAPVGDVNIANKECCIGRGLTAIRANENIIDKMYLFYFLSYKKNVIENMGTGSTFKAISRKDLDSIDITLFSLEKQRKIVQVLEKTKKLINKRKAQIEALDYLEQSVFLEMFGDPDSNIKGWEVKLWNDLFITKTGKLNANAMDVDGKYPFFTCSKETFKINTYSFDQEALILAGNNAVGKYDVKYYKGKFNAYQRTYVISLIEIEANKYEFFKFLLESKLKLLQKNSIGSNTKYLTMQIFKDIDFIVPPYSLQKEFGQIYKDIEKQKIIFEESLVQLEYNFQALTHKAFNGELYN